MMSKNNSLKSVFNKLLQLQIHRNLNLIGLDKLHQSIIFSLNSQLINYLTHSYISSYGKIMMLQINS